MGRDGEGSQAVGLWEASIAGCGITGKGSAVAGMQVLGRKHQGSIHQGKAAHTQAGRNSPAAEARETSQQQYGGWQESVTLLEGGSSVGPKGGQRCCGFATPKECAWVLIVRPGVLLSAAVHLTLLCSSVHLGVARTQILSKQCTWGWRAHTWPKQCARDLRARTWPKQCACQENSRVKQGAQLPPASCALRLTHIAKSQCTQ